MYNNPISTTATLTQAVTQAAQQKVAVATIGNIDDCLMAPKTCEVPVLGDVLTQWVFQSPAQWKAFTLAKPCLKFYCIAGTHTAILQSKYTPNALSAIAGYIGVQK
jgi:hypothetical protein